MDFQLKRDERTGEYYMTTPGPIERMIAKTGAIHEIMDVRMQLRQEWDNMGVDARKREGDSWIKYFRANIDEAMKYYNK